MEEREDTLLFLDELNEWEGEETLERKGKGISTPSPNGHLSRGSAALR